MTTETMRGFDAERLLDKAKKLGCSQAEVYVAESGSTPVSFENNRLKSVNTAETALASVRVIREGRLGFATASKPGDDEVVDLAVRAAEFGPPADLDFAAAAPVETGLDRFDPEVADWPIERMVESGEELVGRLRKLTEGALVSVEVEKETGARRVATSAGQDVRTKGTVAVGVAQLQVVEPENLIWLFHFDASRHLSLDFEALAARVEWLYGHSRRNVTMRSGAYPVLFAPVAGADLIEPMSACLNGKAVVKGESPWKDKAGQRLFSEAFSLYDDPTVPWGLGTTPFDDEGVPTGRRAVIDKGVLREFYLDLRSAKALGKASTGNGFRGGQSPPSPGPSNQMVGPGRESWRDLVKGIEEGLYVGRLMGAWAGNPYAGQVAGNVDVGFKIENGEITGRVKDCMVSVNVFEAFRDHLLALSREAENTPSMSRLPYILLDRTSVSTKG